MLSFYRFLSLSLLLIVSTTTVSASSESFENLDQQQQSEIIEIQSHNNHRQLWGFWTFLFHIHPHQCNGHGPLWHCPKPSEKACVCNGMISSDGSSSSSYSENSDGSQGQDYYVNEMNSGNENYVSDTTQSSNSFFGEAKSMSLLTYLMLAVAAVAASTAMAAVIVGQRKENRHELLAAADEAGLGNLAGAADGSSKISIAGSVTRRMKNFMGFADARPDKVMEMTQSFDSVKEYHMA